MTGRLIKRIAGILVLRRNLIAGIMLALTVACAVLIPFVPIHTDMTEYLPFDSQMKQGIDILAEEFPEMENPSTIRVMFTGLSPQEREEMRDSLSSIEYVDSVDYGSLDARYEDGTHSLYKLL